MSTFWLAVIIITLLRVISMQIDRQQSKYKKNGVYWFYRPGCPHCDNMKSDWETVVKTLPKKYNLNGIDTSKPKNRAICDEFNISSVPQLIKVRYGKPRVYNGSRDASSIIKWIKL